MIICQVKYYHSVIMSCHQPKQCNYDSLTITTHSVVYSLNKGGSNHFIKLKKDKEMTLVKFNNKPNLKPFNYLIDEFFQGFPAVIAKDLGLNVPPVNISETNDAYHLELSAPGRNKEDFNVNIEKGLLTVSFEKKEETTKEDSKSIRKEFTYQNFKRSFSLDDKVDAEKIEAKYENGVLKFVLPKKEEVKQTPKQISIQ